MGEKGGGLFLFLGLLESLSGFLFLLNFCFDGPVSDFHRHAVNGSAGRRGKEVGGIDGLVAIIGVSLGEDDLRDGAGDGDLGV